MTLLVQPAARMGIFDRPESTEIHMPGVQRRTVDASAAQRRRIRQYEPSTNVTNVVKSYRGVK